METSQKRRATKKVLITIQLKHLWSVDWSTKLIKRESHLNTAPPWPPCIQNSCTLTKSVRSQWLSSTWGKGLSIYNALKKLPKKARTEEKAFPIEGEKMKRRTCRDTIGKYEKAPVLATYSRLQDLDWLLAGATCLYCKLNATNNYLVQEQPWKHHLTHCG